MGRGKHGPGGGFFTQSFPSPVACARKSLPCWSDLTACASLMLAWIVRPEHARKSIPPHRKTKQKLPKILLLRAVISCSPFLDWRLFFGAKRKSPNQLVSIGHALAKDHIFVGQQEQIHVSRLNWFRKKRFGPGLVALTNEFHFVPAGDHRNPRWER